MLRLSDQEKIDVVCKYESGLTIAKIAQVYNRCPNAILSILKVRGIKRRDNSFYKKKYSFNEDYFNTIDTEDKAYFLGLMYADGWNLEDRPIIGIQLQERDKEIIEKFVEKIEYSGDLKLKPSRGNRQNCYEIRIFNKNLSKKLSELGCWARKSLTLKFPTEQQVPKYLLNHFVRGYLDGDGYICVQTRKATGYMDYACYITSTVMFCESLKEFIKKELDIHCTICHCNKRKDKTTRQLSIAGRIQTKKFLDWIYKDATIYLERKHQKYLLF